MSPDFEFSIVYDEIELAVSEAFSVLKEKLLRFNIVEIMAYLRTRSIPVGVISNSSKVDILKRIGFTKIASYFNPKFVSGNDCGFDKKNYS